MKVGIVADPARKTNGRALADILFAKAPLYRLAAQYCRKNYDKFFVLSTKYGLIDPYETIESYDYPIKYMRTEEYAEWLVSTIQKVLETVPTGSEIYFHTGFPYRKDLVPALIKDYKCFEPMKNMGIGQQLKFYKAELGLSKED